MSNRAKKGQAIDKQEEVLSDNEQLSDTARHARAKKASESIAKQMGKRAAKRAAYGKYECCAA